MYCQFIIILIVGISAGRVRSLAWTSDGYALAVGYENGWAVWSVGGRLCGWGLAKADEDEEPREGFMCGVIDLVSDHHQTILELMDSFGHLETYNFSSCQVFFTRMGEKISYISCHL